MDNVSQEIVNIIVQHLEPPYSRYATISHRFQQAIEQRTFDDVDAESTETGLDFFDKTFASTHRRRHVNRLSYLVVLPQPSKTRLKKFQSDAEAAENNRIFTRGITDLFQRLIKWNGDGRKGATLQLNLTVESPPVDDEVFDELQEELAEKYDEMDMELDSDNLGEFSIWNVRDVGCFLRLEDNLVLPMITAVTRLDLGSKRQLHPLALKPLVAALPKLDGLQFFHSPPPRRLHNLRKELFQSMGGVFQKLNLDNLTSLHIQYRDRQPQNEGHSPPSLLDSTDERDAFSFIFQKASQLPNLQTLAFKEMCCIESTFFALPSSSVPFFPRLRTLCIEISPLSAAGHWYLTGDASDAIRSEEVDWPSDPDPDMISDDSDGFDYPPLNAWHKDNGDDPFMQYRSRPDSSTVTPLTLGFVDFIQKVPNLETAMLRIGNSTSAGILSLEYCAASRMPSDMVFGRCATAEKDFLTRFEAVERWSIRMFKAEEFFETDWDVPEEIVHAMKGKHGDGKVLKSVVPTAYTEL